MTPAFERLSQHLKKKHSRKRFEHSLCVADLAGRLGAKYGWAPERARLAGLLHDCAKEWSPSKLLSYAKRYKLKIPSRDLIVKESPNHLHAYVGADVVRRQGWITNTADIKAIESHTFGSPKMSLQDKILYVADLSSVDRTYSKAKAVRKLALKSLEEGFRLAVSFKLKHQMRKMRFIHPIAIEMWNRSCVVRGSR